jgi:hypothetical protein
VANARVSSAVVLMLALSAPAIAQEQTPRQEYEAITGQPKRAPVIPRELRAMVAEATPDRLVVRGLDGQRLPVSLDWIEPIEFAVYREGRFLGFAYSGYEAEGYVLVDRIGNGESAVIATGHAPAFSPDGRFFAAAEMTDSGFGNLNGVALWEVLPDRTVRRLFTDALARSFDWRVDGWVRSDCVAMSAIEIGWQPPDGQEWEQAVRNAPRINYAMEIGDGIVLSPTYDRPPCVPPEMP